MGGVIFERLKELHKLYPKLVKLPLTATFDEVCQHSNAANEQHTLSLDVLAPTAARL